MNLIRLSIERPVAILAAVLMVVMFGILALVQIPIQLTPRRSQAGDQPENHLAGRGAGRNRA